MYNHSCFLYGDGYAILGRQHFNDPYYDLAIVDYDLSRASCKVTVKAWRGYGHTIMTVSEFKTKYGDL